MKAHDRTVGEELRRQGISRRSFLKFCAVVASSMAIPATMVAAMAQSLAQARRQNEGKFAKTFDDEGARKGWCLYELGCKGPTTHNACATLKWNGGTSWPVQSGHGCLGCSEPDFWDRGSVYEPLLAEQWGPPWRSRWGSSRGTERSRRGSGR